MSSLRNGLGAVALWSVCSLVTATGLPIDPGSSLSGIAVLGTSSIYDVFGHAGNPGGDYGPDSPATLISFAPGTGNTFNFSASGLVSCCSDAPNIAPDGGNSPTSIAAANGLSGIAGNGNLPLVGVFTSEVDPFGATAPAGLSFDVNNPLSLSPLLNQVFYIGDGKAGRNNAAGAALNFTAPASATRLYIGVIDAYSFGGLPGYYNDNHGQFTVDVMLAAVPEPASAPMALLGGAALMLAGWIGRRKARRAPAVTLDANDSAGRRMKLPTD